MLPRHEYFAVGFEDALFASHTDISLHFFKTRQEAEEKQAGTVLSLAARYAKDEREVSEIISKQKENQRLHAKRVMGSGEIK